MKSYFKFAIALMLALGTAPALAQYVDGSELNTAADTTVTNTATITYTVEGVEQETTGDSVEFKVDRVILLTVTSNGDKNVVPGQDEAYLSFDVRNDSNDTIDMILLATNSGGDFDTVGLKYYIDTDPDAGGPLTANGTFGPEDVELTTVGDGILLANRAEGTTATIFVVGDIPTPTEATDATQTVANGDTDDITLLATAYTNDGLGTTAHAETNTGVADDPNVVDTVFGDEQGAVDADEDGKHSATGIFTIATASITVLKSSKVISDPFNGISANAKAIPGAVIEYCILVTNGGPTDATGVKVSDPIPDFTTYVASSLHIADDCDRTNAVNEDDDAAGADETDPNGGNYDATVGSEAVNTEVATLTPGGAHNGATATIFQVIVD